MYDLRLAGILSTQITRYKFSGICMASLLKPTDENLNLLRNVLKSGGLVAVPTETVYGLAANAFDAEACARIFTAKGRPTNDPLICHIASLEVAESISSFNELSRKLARLFWPGPLTLILPKAKTIPDIVTAGLASVAIRCPMHSVFQQLISEIDFPLAAPSANPFAYISPTTATHVNENLGEDIDYILDGGPCELGLESTIIDARDESSPLLLRHGALSQEEIETTAGIRLIDKSSNITQGPSVAPGSALKHYSPKTGLTLSAAPIKEPAAVNPDTAYLLWKKPEGKNAENIFWLSASGSLTEAASRLYAALHEIDQLGYQQIIAQTFPEQGMGNAINDRLRRAAAK
jgi:L-threonylcarbamoyladenylate synthase